MYIFHSVIAGKRRAMFIYWASYEMNAFPPPPQIIIGVTIMNSKILVDSCVFINSFQSDSIYREASIAFLDLLLSKNQLITMPAHGWFEVWCTLRRLSEVDRKYTPPIFQGAMKYPVELIHIDAQFITKYGNLDIPYTKAGDHIFIAVAFANGYPLITWDNGMIKAGKEIGINVYTPDEYVTILKGFTQQ
jgi:predicted nucleic acid-binding protein